MDFKREQLVNINEEGMTTVKGGVSTWPCARGGLFFAGVAYGYGKYESYWHCGNGGGGAETGDFYISKIQSDEVTCATIDWVQIQGY